MRPGAEHRGADVNAPGLQTFVIEVPLQGIYTHLLGRLHAERHNAWKTGLEDASKGIGLIRGLHPGGANRFHVQTRVGETAVEIDAYLQSQALTSDHLLDPAWSFPMQFETFQAGRRQRTVLLQKDHQPVGLESLCKGGCCSYGIGLIPQYSTHTMASKVPKDSGMSAMLLRRSMAV